MCLNILSEIHSLTSILCVIGYSVINMSITLPSGLVVAEEDDQPFLPAELSHPPSIISCLDEIDVYALESKSPFSERVIELSQSLRDIAKNANDPFAEYEKIKGSNVRKTLGLPAHEAAMRLEVLKEEMQKFELEYAGECQSLHIFLQKIAEWRRKTKKKKGSDHEILNTTNVPTGKPKLKDCMLYNEKNQQIIPKNAHKAREVASIILNFNDKKEQKSVHWDEVHEKLQNPQHEVGDHKKAKKIIANHVRKINEYCLCSGCSNIFDWNDGEITTLF